MSNNKRTSLIIALSCFTLLISGIAIKRRSNEELTVFYDVLEDKKFNGVCATVSIDDFIDEGFSFGDSCDVYFSNGFVLKDIPFYNGYYVKSGQPLIVGYPGYEYLTITKSSVGLWDESELKENDQVKIILKEKGKYLNVQESLNQSYSLNRDDYSSDNQFINARALCAGNIKENTFFRGTSPFDDSKGRADCASKYIEDNNIQFILDLADKDNELNVENIKSNYLNLLLKENKVALLGLSASYSSDDYKQRLANGFRKMLESDGPVYIHCLEGKDRTGFVCFLIESLAQSSYEEMQEDYMKTYENYYGISKEKTPDKYEAIVDIYFNSFVEYLLSDDDSHNYLNVDFQKYAVNYLLSSGLSQMEIDKIIDYINK